jgi:hypothetical protein
MILKNHGQRGGFVGVWHRTYDYQGFTINRERL